MKTGAEERKGPHALPRRWRGIVSTSSRKGRSPLALLFFPLRLRRAGFTVARKAGAGRCSFPGAWGELGVAGRPRGPAAVLPVRGHRWFFLNNFYTQLKEKTPVNRKRVGTQRAKPKPVRVFPRPHTLLPYSQVAVVQPPQQHPQVMHFHARVRAEGQEWETQTHLTTPVFLLTSNLGFFEETLPQLRV